jgi:hypothetical protein
MEICGEEFTTTDSAMQYIDNTINEFYEDNYPDIFEEQSELINKAVKGLQTEFKKNIYPEMKVRWDAYSNHIGHVEFNGCFRCHDDNHANDEDKLISKDCNLCHLITAQGPPDSLMAAPVNEFLEFKHPTDIDEEWKESLCTDCHTGLDP